MLIVAFFSKAVGAGLPALWSGLSRRDAVSVGVAMTSRGAVGLVILEVIADGGLFLPPPGADGVLANLYSALVIMVVVSTLIMPLVLARLWPGKSRVRPTA